MVTGSRKLTNQSATKKSIKRLSHEVTTASTIISIQDSPHPRVSVSIYPFPSFAPSTNLVGHLDAGVQEQRAHQRLETVGHGVPQLEVVAEIGAVRVQQVLVQAQVARQHGQVLVLHDRRSDGTGGRAVSGLYYSPDTGRC